MSTESRDRAADLLIDLVQVHTAHLHIDSIEDFVAAAEQVNQFLLRPEDSTQVFVITIGPIRDQATNRVVDNPLERINGMTGLKDNQQFTFSVASQDAKGFATTDPVTASSSDDTVVTVSGPDATGQYTAVAGSPGNAVIMVTDGTINGTLAVDVTAGDTASIVVTPGAVTDQPAPTPAPTPEPTPTPAPEPTPTPAPTPAPSDALPLYTYSGDPSLIDSNWTSAGSTPDGTPLFTYAGDTPGQPATGDGLGGVWHLYTPPSA